MTVQKPEILQQDYLSHVGLKISLIFLGCLNVKDRTHTSIRHTVVITRVRAFTDEDLGG